NPLFVAAVLAGLESGGTRSDLPGDVAAAVRRRLSRLPAATQDLLRAGSIVGLEFDLRVVGSVLGVPLGDTLEAVDAAVRGHLAEEIGVNRCRFTHALVRSALRREIGPSRAAHFHGLVGEALETVHADRLDEHVDELAYHYGEAAATGGPADRALHYTVEAARRAEGQYASQTAAERYRRALELLDADRDIDAHAHCEVLVALGKAELNASDFGGAQTTLRRAALEAEAAGFPELMTQAACYLEISMTYPGLSGDEAAELLERSALR